MTAAEKKALSRKLYMNGYTKAQAAAILVISDALIEDYWEEWEEAWTRKDDGLYIRDDRLGFLMAAEHGAGAVGTGIVPKTYRHIDSKGDIITEIQIDLTGLKCKGDAQGDVIALTGAGFIGRYVVASYGYCYKIEMICVETPTEGTATFEQDIDLMADDSAVLAYDGAADDTVIAAARDWVAGEHAVNLVPKLTANDYLYLGEGDTGASTGVYGAGQFIIRLYGHPALV